MDLGATVESENNCSGDHSTPAYDAARMRMYDLYANSSSKQMAGIFTGNMKNQMVGDVAIIADPVPGYDPYAHVPLNATAAVASMEALPGGTVTQMTVIADVSRLVSDRVVLVGYWELMDLQRQKTSSG